MEVRLSDRVKSTLNTIIVAGYDVIAYMSTFSALEKDQILGKLVLLYSTHDNISVDNPGMYSLPRLVLNRLFLSEKVPHVVKKLAPLATGPFNSVTSNGGLISPQSPARSVGRPIDPSLVSLLLFRLALHVTTYSFVIASAQTYVSLNYLNTQLISKTQKTPRHVMNTI